MVNFTEILVWGCEESIIDRFIKALNDEAKKFYIVFSRVVTSKTKAVVFLYGSDEGYNFIEYKANELTMSKFIIHVLPPGKGRMLNHGSMWAVTGVKIGNLSIDLTDAENKTDLMEYISEVLQKKYKVLWFNFSHKTMAKVKWVAFGVDLMSAILAVILMFLAGIVTVSREKTEERWFANSLLTSGNLTFVMSFVGFYGVKKSGVKEYLKIYSGVLFLNSCYKIILLCMFYIMSWKTSLEKILVPVVGTSIIFEVITAFIIFLELNVVKTKSQDHN